MSESKGSAIVAWKEKMAALTTQAVEAEKPTGGFISFKGGRMSYNDQLIPGDKINCVIVDSMIEYNFYKEKYNADKLVSPVCYAYGHKEKDLKPHEDAEEPQHENCVECPNNEWGSDPEGGKGKACKNTRRIALIPADAALTPEGIAGADIVFAKIPVTSVRNFSNFVNQVATLGVPPFGVLCEISVVPDNKTLFQVRFKALKQIEGDELLSSLVAKNAVAAAKMAQPYPRNEEAEAPSNKKYS